MSKDIELNISKTPKLTLQNHLMKSVHELVFPLLRVQLTPDTKLQDYEIEVRVNSKIHEFIDNTASSDQIFLYLSLSNPSIGFWTSDMMAAFNTLSELGIIDDMKTWISTARASIASVLSKGKVNSKKTNPKALKKAEEMLDALEVLEAVKQQELLPLIVHDIVEQKNMDANTIIYRLAMAIYHAKTATNTPVIEAIEDPSSLYLKLTQSSFYKSNKNAFETIVALPLQFRNPAVKLLVCFAIAAYVYHTHA